MTETQIMQLTCKKHIKIYKLKQIGMANKAIAAALGTNVGHIYNVLKDYANKPELVEKSNLLQI